MKRSTKRCLILSIVIAIVAMTMVCVSAAYVSVAPDTIYCHSAICNGTRQTASLGEVHAPQCDAEGYTDIVCDNCGAVWGTTGKVDKLGHELNKEFEYKLSGDKTHYYKLLKCSREGCGYEIEEGKPDAVVKYCKVNFINDFVTDTYEDDAFCSYATLAKTYKTEVETKYVEYPAEGSTQVLSSKEPVRIADRTFGRYVFAGWLDETKILEAITNEDDAETGFDTAVFNNTNKIMSVQTVDVNNGERQYTFEEKHDSLVAAAKAYTPAVSATTPAELNLYVVFEVDTAVTHKVTFLNYDGTKLAEVTDARHAIEDVEYTGTTPLRADNVEYTYEFAYWSVYNSTTPMGNKMDSIPAVYGDVKVMATYNSVLRQYNFKYFDKDGNLFGDTIDIVTIAGIGKDKKNPEYGPTIDVPDYFDAKYVYEHVDNLWMIPSRGNYVVDLDNIRLPEGTLDNKEVDYIALVPYYQPYLRSYKLVVNVIYEDDDNSYYHPAELTIEVRDADGKGIGYIEVDQDPKYYKDGTYTVEFDVNYSSSYTIAVSSEGYSGKTTTQFHEFNPDDPSDDKPGNAIVILQRTADNPCSCICHTFFKPVWVGILNLLNSLFKLEYVCCDDMFANIGSQLNYGPASLK